MNRFALIVALALSLGLVLAPSHLPVTAAAQPAGEAPTMQRAPAQPTGGSPGATSHSVTVSGDTLWVVPQVTPSVVRLGQRFAIRVAVPHAPGDSLLGPPAPLQAGDLDIMASAAAPADGDTVAWVMRGALFRIGDQELPPMPFLLRGPGGDRLVVTRPYTVSVEATVAADSAAAMDLHAVRDPIAAPTRLRWLRVAGAVVLAALLAAGILLLVRRRGNGEDYVAPAAPRIPAHVEAFLALEELEKEALPQRGLIKDHYFGLSHVMRQYVERRFDIPAVESTTDEIRGQIDRTPMITQDAEELLRELEAGDLVKFAKYDPGVEAATEALARGRQWVERTVPRTEDAS